MTLILALAAIFAFVYAIALHARVAASDAWFAAEERFADEFGSYKRIGNSRVYDWPAESDGIDVPLDGPPIVVIPMQQVYDEIHLALWEDELEGTGE